MRIRIYPRPGKYRRYWYVDYVENGRRKRESKGTKPEAEAFRDGLIAQRLKELSGQTTVIPHLGNTSWIDFMTRYFDYTRQIHQPQTVTRDKGRVKSFINYIQKRHIEHLDQTGLGIMAEFQSEYLATHTAKSWNNLLGLIKAMLNRAVDWELIAKNPIAKMKPLRIDKRVNYFSKSQVAKIINACPDDIRDAVIILVSTGMRRGELYNLRWRDLDLKARKIIIQGHKDIGTRTKAGNIRSIPVSASLCGVLMKRKKALPGEYVCRPFADINSLYRAFGRVLAFLKIPGTLHDLRHTFASHLAMNGTPIPVISELLGHSNIQTTMIYSHLSPESHRAAIDALDFVP